MKKITWFGVTRSPYNDFLLTEVHKSFLLHVYYKHKSISTHPWQLMAVEYKFDYIDNRFFRVFKDTLKSDIVVMSGWSYWQHLLLMFFLPKKTKKIYWTDTPDLQEKLWSGVKGYLRRIIVKIVFTVFDEVWSTGAPGCNALKVLGCSPRKIKSFPFFLDLTRYKKVDVAKRLLAEKFRREYSNNTNCLVFLCMGQLAKKKRYSDAIEALAMVKDSNAVLWIAGKGPELAELKSLAIRLEVFEQVFFLGWLEWQEIELAFIAANIFVHPSEFDPFPTVVLDAMTWGKPIIGTGDSGSVVDRVGHGTNGFVYETGNISTLATHMRFFLDSPEKAKQFGKESRLTAIGFPVESAIAQLQSL